MLRPDDEKDIAVNRRGSLVHRSAACAAPQSRARSATGRRPPEETRGRTLQAASLPYLDDGPLCTASVSSELVGAQPRRMRRRGGPSYSGLCIGISFTEYYFADGKICSGGQRSPRDASGVLVLPRRRAAPVGMPLGRSIWSIHSAISHVGVIRQGCGRLLLRLCLQVESIQVFAAGRSYFFLGPTTVPPLHG